MNPEILASIPWDAPPLCWLSPDQQVQVKNQAAPLQVTLGEVIWSNDESERQFLIVAGNVRLVPDDGKPVLLKPGDWFGHFPALTGLWKARGASKEVQLLAWDGALWESLETPESKPFWLGLRSRYQPEFSSDPQPIAGYPYVASVNSAAASLTMLAQYLEAPTQLEWVQRQLRGQQAKNLTDTAEKLGIQLKRLVIGEWSDLRHLNLPALLHWNAERWVVVYGVRGDRLIIADPFSSNQSCESIPKAVVLDAWDGQLWLAEAIQKQNEFNLKWFLPAVWRYRQLLWEVLVASFTLQLLGLGAPIFTQVVIDKVMVQESISTLDVMGIAILSVAVFESVLGILRMFIFTHTTNRLDLALSAQVFRHLLRLPLSYFEARRVGDTVARVQELEEIRQFLTSTALTVILDSIFAVIYLAVMFYYSIKLTWVALAVLPLFALLTLVSTPILRNWLNETFNRSADSQSFLVETITGIHSVKAHAAEKASRDRWEGLYARFIRTGFKATTTANISNHIGDFLT
ncbi:MAG TPA: ABC transporter transmembrane domain-containing protein, partial [Chroococcidiopsis sp.]